MIRQRVGADEMVGDAPLWRTAVEHPKATTLVLLFALTIALAGFGAAADLAGVGVPAAPDGWRSGP
jgi:hypothetical protein